MFGASEQQDCDARGWQRGELTMKPMIGVVPLYDDERQSMWMLPGYFEGLRRAGAIPVMLPMNLSEEDFRQIRTSFAGFLLTGGHDVDPARYHERRLPVCGDPCPERDALEALVFKYCYADDWPLLGICRGNQFINVMMGGTLYQDLPSQYEGSGDVQVQHVMERPYDRVQHRDHVLRGTPLWQLLHKREIGVNSYHHQGIRELADGLKPMAVAEDGLVEAVYVPDHYFIWGVQWHPEFSYRTDPDSAAIFKAFVQACH